MILQVHAVLRPLLILTSATPSELLVPPSPSAGSHLSPVMLILFLHFI